MSEDEGSVPYSDDSSSIVSFTSEIDDPVVKEKFTKLSSVLRETNHNLSNFELLLNHYRGQQNKESSQNVMDTLKSEISFKNREFELLAKVSSLECVISERDILINRLQSEGVKKEDSNKLLMDDISKLKREKESYKGKYKRAILCSNEIGDKAKEVELEKVVAKSNQQIVEYEAQLTELKGCLESLQSELKRFHQDSVKDTDKLELKLNELKSALVFEKNLHRKSQLKTESMNQRIVELKSSYQNLKNKCRCLLQKYKKTKQELLREESSSQNMHEALLELRGLCRKSSDNYRHILQHFGSQIEISARLFASRFNGVNEKFSIEPPSKQDTDRLTDWFCHIQNVSHWLQQKLVHSQFQCGNCGQDDRHFHTNSTSVLRNLMMTIEETSISDVSIADDKTEKSAVLEGIREIVDKQNETLMRQNETFNRILVNQIVDI